MTRNKIDTTFLIKTIKGFLKKAVLDSHPKILLPKYLSKSKNTIQINKEIYDISNKNIYVIGFGKAGSTMAEMVEKIVGEDYINDGLVISPKINSNINSIKIIQSSHPFLSDMSFSAGKKMIEFVENIPDGSIVLCLVSGGGSALLALPVKGIGYSEKITFFEFLLFQGLSEIDQNIVRKAISSIKGGKLAKRLKNKILVNLVIMDNPYDYKALSSGPTFIPNDKKTAKHILIELGIYQSLPSKIKKVINLQSFEKFDDSDLTIQDVVIGGPEVPKISLYNNLSKICSKVWLIKESFYYRDILDVKKEFTEFCLEKYHGIDKPGLYAIVANGEIPVKVEKNGKGGRNQHFAALMLNELKNIDNFVFTSYATDGCDYIEGVHGALITNETINMINNSKINVSDYIKQFNTFYLHERLGTLIKGPTTGTNCSDVYIFLFQK